MLRFRFIFWQDIESNTSETFEVTQIHDRSLSYCFTLFDFCFFHSYIQDVMNYGIDFMKDMEELDMDDLSIPVCDSDEVQSF